MNDQSNPSQGLDPKEPIHTAFAPQNQNDVPVD